MTNTKQEQTTQDFLQDYDEKVIALAQHLDLNLEPDFESYVDEEASAEEQEEQRAEAIKEVTDELDSIVENSWGTYNYYGREYDVLTDEEADDRWEQELDNYIDECIMPELEKAEDSIGIRISYYFDDEAWKRDARIDGRGHTLSRYDGCEYEEKVNGTWYYIYRQD